MAADAPIVWMPGGVRTEIHLTAQDTEGAFCLLVDHPPVGWSLPAHRHHNEAETVYIREGHFEMEIDGQRSELSAGEAIRVPRGVIHSSANIGQQAGERAVLFSPAGIESFFLEVGAPSPDGETDRAAALVSATRHGWEFITKPPAP